MLVCLHAFLNLTIQLYNEFNPIQCNFPPYISDRSRNSVRSSAFRSSRVSPAYDDSFMVKNNILSRECFSLLSKDSRKYEIDVMLVRGNPIDVVNNFDLNVCQVFFDGKNNRYFWL